MSGLSSPASKARSIGLRTALNAFNVKQVARTRATLTATQRASSSKAVEATDPAPIATTTITTTIKPHAPTPARTPVTTASTPSHSDLSSFLEYASRVNLASTSTVFVGTHYEYTVLTSLGRLGMSLMRVGGRSDAGIDLLGQWDLGALSLDDKQQQQQQQQRKPPLKIVVQCKALQRRAGPHLIRELEGAFAGVPMAYRGRGLLGLLTAPKEATAGVRDAMGRSRMPLGFAMIGLQGRITQLLWNQVARDIGLHGLGVTTSYVTVEDTASTKTEPPSGHAAADQRDLGIHHEVALTWKGNVLPPWTTTTTTATSSREDFRNVNTPRHL